MMNKLSELESNLEEFKSYVEGESGEVDITGALVDGFVRYTDGQVFTNPTGSTAGQYSRTDYLSVTVGDKLRVFTGGISSNAIVAAFDADKNYIQASSIVGSQSSSNPTTTIDYVVPDGVAYIIITTRNDFCPNPKVTKEYGSDRNYLKEKFPNKETLDKMSTDEDGNLLFDGNPVKDEKLETKVDGIGKKVDTLDNYINGQGGGEEGWTDITTDLVDGFVIYKDQGVANRGKVYDTAGTYHRTKPIKVEEGDVLKIKTVVASSCFVFATYDNSVNENSSANELTAAFVDLPTLPKGSTVDVTGLKEYDFVVPSGVGYIIVSMSNTFIETYGNPLVLKHYSSPKNFVQDKFPNKATTDKFSEMDGVLLWNNKPIEGGGGGISSLVLDLPVSDGSDIEKHYAYIDSLTNVIKVKQ